MIAENGSVPKAYGNFRAFYPDEPLRKLTAEEVARFHDYLPALPLAQQRGERFPRQARRQQMPEWWLSEREIRDLTRQSAECAAPKTRARTTGFMEDHDFAKFFPYSDGTINPPAVPKLERKTFDGPGGQRKGAEHVDLDFGCAYESVGGVQAYLFPVRPETGCSDAMRKRVQRQAGRVFTAKQQKCLSPDDRTAAATERWRPYSLSRRPDGKAGFHVRMALFDRKGRALKVPTIYADAPIGSASLSAIGPSNHMLPPNATIPLTHFCAGTGWEATKTQLDHRFSHMHDSERTVRPRKLLSAHAIRHH